MTVEDLKERFDQIYKLSRHFIPVYAYGDNEAACEMAARLRNIEDLADIEECEEVRDG